MLKQKTFKGLEKSGYSFGGSLLNKSHAKTQRPLDSKLPIHLVLKAEKSVLRLHKNFAKVEACVSLVVKKHGVKLYKHANVGNHMHMLIKIRSRRSWAGFIRELTGRIAQITGTGWVQRPFTRVIGGWRKAFRIAKDYILLNQWEALGFINRKETKTVKDLRPIF